MTYIGARNSSFTNISSHRTSLVTDSTYTWCLLREHSVLIIRNNSRMDCRRSRFRLRHKSLLGLGKQPKISIKAKLYRNGILVSEITNRSRNLFHGCRGSVYIIGSTVDGTILWETQLRGKTAGGLLDCLKARVTHRISADDVPNTHHMDVFYDLQELLFIDRFRHVSHSQILWFTQFFAQNFYSL